METYLVICEIDFYFDDGKSDTTTHSEMIAMTEVHSYSDAVTRAEAYYGEDLISIKVTLIEGPFCPLNDYMVDQIMTGEV